VEKLSGVYKIENLVDGKVYVGSSKTLVTRKNQHFSALRRNKHGSAYLQHAFNKFGEVFEFIVLEKDVPSENLIKREQFYIDTHQAASPKYGYNLCPTAGSQRGRKHSVKALRKISGGPYTFLNPKGGAITRNSFMDFEREFGLDHSHLGQVYKEKQSDNKGWRKFNENKINTACLAKIRPHTFISPEGAAITRDSLMAFEREFGLHNTALGLVEKGKNKQHKGWTI